MDEACAVSAPGGTDPASTRQVLASLAARKSFGRLVAFLSAKTRDLVLAEELMAEALARALETWPRQGVPTDPTAWLLRVAHRSFIDGMRHQSVVRAASDELVVLFDELAQSSEQSMQDRQGVPDDRLQLLFVCAHPAIDESARSPLMLQVVFGFDAARIGTLFLTSAKTMGQRLVRAKNKIRAAGIRFEVPDTSALPVRLEPVLDALYAAYTAVSRGRSSQVESEGMEGQALISELVWLARLLTELLPGEPEAVGLLALMLHIEARRGAAQLPQTVFVPLHERDATAWNLQIIDEADALLVRSAGMQQFGRFQLEAAIQSAHNARARGASVEWPAIVQLYEVLCLHWPTVGARVAHAAAQLHAGRVTQAIASLNAIATTSPAHQSYQPYWATRAAVLAASANFPAAARAYQLALGLTEDPDVRDFLLVQARKAELGTLQVPEDDRRSGSLTG